MALSLGLNDPYLEIGVDVPCKASKLSFYDCHSQNLHAIHSDKTHGTQQQEGAGMHKTLIWALAQELD